MVGLVTTAPTFFLRATRSSGRIGRAATLVVPRGVSTLATALIQGAGTGTSAKGRPAPASGREKTGDTDRDAGSTAASTKTDAAERPIVTTIPRLISTADEIKCAPCAY